MGNKNDKEEKSVILEDEQITISHPRLQKATYKKSQNREYIVTTLPVANNKDYDSWAKNIKDSPVTDSTYALNPLKHTYKKAGMCGNSGFATLQYDNHPFLLSTEILTRAKTQTKFTEPELWYLLSGLTDVTSKFHKRGEKAGDIRPQNIFLNENGSFKIATKDSWPGEVSSYQKRLFEEQKTYLSPEESNDIVIGRQTPQVAPQIAQSFSVGLTCLSAATLKDGDKIYENKSKFSIESFEESRYALKTDSLYSDLLKFVVLSLCDPQNQHRSTSQEINSWLKPNQSKILALQPFGVNILPSKVQMYADYWNAPRKNMNQNIQTPFIAKLESCGPCNTSNIVVLEANPQSEEVIKKANVSWSEIEEKIRKSKEMFPS